MRFYKGSHEFLPRSLDGFYTSFGKVLDGSTLNRFGGYLEDHGT